MSSLRIASRRLAKLGVAGFESLMSPRQPGPRILIYHQVGRFFEREMEVRRAAFEAHIAWLLDRYRVAPLCEVIARRHQPGADRLVAITFDDGYADTFDTAFPIMQAMAVPFVVYIATEMVSTGAPLDPRYPAPPLTWAQIEQLADSDLVTIGTHTHSHLDLRDATQAQVEREVEQSDAVVWERLGTRLVHFAYPWGYWGEVAERVLRERYESAVLGGGAPIGPDTSPLRLNRIPIQLSDGVIGFRSKIRSGGRFEEQLRRRVTGYSGP